MLGAVLERDGHAGVDATGEAAVLGQADQVDARELGGDGLRPAVRGAVVDDDGGQRGIRGLPRATAGT